MAPTKQISTSVGFQDPKGTVVANGMLMLQLSQTCTVTATGGQVTTEPIYLTLDANGKITTTAIWFNDELSPSGTIYYGTVYASNKTRRIPGLENLQYSITGASFDLATAVQSGSASPSFSGAVLLTPAGNQVITTGNLTLSTGDLILTAGNTSLASGKVIKWNSDTGFSRDSAGVLDLGNGTQGDKSGTLLLSKLAAGGTSGTGSVAGDITAARSATQGAVFIGTDGNGQLFRNGNTVSLAGTSLTWTFPATTDTLAGKATTDTLSNKTLTGASSANSVTLLNAQGALGALTGNNTDQTVYTYTIPAGTIGAGKGIRVTVFYVHTTGNGAITYKMNLGSTALDTQAITDNANAVSEMWQGVILNNAGVQNAQTFSRLFYTGATAAVTSGVTAGTSAENTANALILKWTFNAANTEQVTGKQWLVELIQ